MTPRTIVTRPRISVACQLLIISSAVDGGWSTSSSISRSFLSAGIDCAAGRAPDGTGGTDGGARAAGRRRSAHLQQVELPRLQIDVQPGVGQLAAAAGEVGPAERIKQPPPAARQVRPRKPDL